MITTSLPWLLEIVIYCLPVVLGPLSFFLYSQRQELKLANGILHDAINTPSHGLIFFDHADRFFMANRQAMAFLPELCDYSSSYRQLGDFLNYMYDHAVDIDQSLRNTLDRAAERMGIFGFREIIEWRPGRQCLVEAIKTASGRTVLVIVDVSAVRKHEEGLIRLNDYSAKVTQAIDVATNAIIITSLRNFKSAVIFANQTFCDYLGVEKDEIIGLGIEAALESVADEEARLLLLDAVTALEPQELELRVNFSAAPQWFNVRFTDVLSRDGEKEMRIGVLTDTTQLKTREQEFFQAQKLEALGQLAAGVAHDFNNLLSIVGGYARLAHINIDDADVARAHLDKVSVAVDRGASLTQQMLIFSRHKIVGESVVDLVQTVEDHLTLMRPLMGETVHIVFQTDLKACHVECTQDDVAQILMNLAVNARDAMPGGGRFVINIENIPVFGVPDVLQEKFPDTAFVRLSATDTGTGMTEETQKRIFDPFFTTKGQGKGTGLGLSVVYGLVQKLGGLIEVESVLGKGTTFSVTLPLTEKQPTQMITGSPEDIESLNLQGYVGMVVEDEPDLLLLVSEMFERLGMEVIRASNGNEALMKQEDHDGKIDILLTDLVMPELGGVKLAELFRSLRPDTKIIVMSGYPSNAEDGGVAVPEGIPFLAKPFKFEILARVVCESLSEQNASSEGGSAYGARWKHVPDLPILRNHS